MLLEPDAAGDVVRARPRRVLVAGTSGAGKTSLAARIGNVLDLPHIEIDALFHGPGWTPRPEFRADVAALAAQQRWVTEWQYSAVRDALADRADLMVWLDLPRARVMRQVVVRTLLRRVRRQQLWNGNVEPALWTVLRDPGHIVRRAWRTHSKSAERIATLQQRRPELPFVRLHDWQQAHRWLDTLTHRTP